MTDVIQTIDIESQGSPSVKSRKNTGKAAEQGGKISARSSVSKAKSKATKSRKSNKSNVSKDTVSMQSYESKVKKKKKGTQNEKTLEYLGLNKKKKSKK